MARHRKVEHEHPPAPVVIRRPVIKRVTTHLGLALLSMVLLSLAFPPVGWWWLAHVALVPMVLLALRSASGWRVFWTVYVAAAAWWFYAIRWMTPVTFVGYLFLSLWMAMYVALAMVLLRYLNKRYRPAMVMALPMVWVSLDLIRGHVPQGGFGWFTLGQSQAPFGESSRIPLLIQIADLFGENGVTFLVAMTNGLIVDLLYRPWFRLRQGGGTRFSKTITIGTVFWVAAMIGTVGYGGYSAYQLTKVIDPSKASPSVAITVIQTNIPQSNKESPTAESDIRNWDRMVELTRQAARETGAPIIVWPETMVPASVNEEAVDLYRDNATYYREQAADPSIDAKKREEMNAHAEDFARAAQYREQIIRLAQELQCHLIVGASGNFPGEPTRRHTNSAYLFRATGGVDSTHYDKIHRVPYGEYIPWFEDWPWAKAWFVKYMAPGGVDYTVSPGSTSAIFQIDLDADIPFPQTAPALSSSPPGDAAVSDQASSQPAEQSPRPVVLPSSRALPKLRVAAPICFEDSLDVICRDMVYGSRGQKRVDVLVNLTNDGWFAGSAEPYQQLQLATLRCVENRVPMARSVNTGVSSFIDSEGRVTQLLGPGRDGFLTANVELDPRQTLYGRVGLWPAIVLAIATAGLLVGARFRRNK